MQEALDQQKQPTDLKDAIQQLENCDSEVQSCPVIHNFRACIDAANAGTLRPGSKCCRELSAVAKCIGDDCFGDALATLPSPDDVQSLESSCTNMKFLSSLYTGGSGSSTGSAC